MCLFDIKRFRFTFKRIPIYKVVYRKDCEDENDKLYSMCKDYPIKRRNIAFNGMFQKKRMFVKRDKNNFYTEELFYVFSKGFFHAYTNPLRARKTISIEEFYNKVYSRCNPDYSRTFLIITGYIPAFTRYAIDGTGCICARRMVYNI